MTTVNVVALDGGSPSALGITIDVLDAANRVLGSERAAFDWRLLTATGAPASLRHGISAPAESLLEAKPAAAAVVLGIGAAEPERLEARLSAADVVLAAQW